ncbi:Proton pump-interactor 1 [Acorus gramineus]|uniref:Proton pump-interactor 1 n=1 Tax=Acorus gramineus TaxID=55184 RepID=A0AAV9BJA8_ACOGR|nr:Proton pump-interactor 1 [Acorus gramineus]
MGMEIVGTDFAEVQVKDGFDGNETFPSKIDNGTKLNTEQENTEPIQFGAVDGKLGINGLLKGAENVVTNANFPQGASEEWPEPKQIHSFYFVKFRPYDDPKLKAKLEQADKECQRKSQARSQIIDALKEKRAERSSVFAELRPLISENKRYKELLDQKRKEMEPLHSALGKLRNANNAAREKGMGICSSEEELDELIRSLNYRLEHESNTILEEKQLLKDIKQLQGTRKRVIQNAAMKAKIQDSMGEKEVIQDQVKQLGVDFDGVKKEQKVFSLKIQTLDEKLKVIDSELEALEVELEDATLKKDKAYETLHSLRKARDEGNACFYQNRTLLNNAKVLAAKKDIAAVEELCTIEVDKFISEFSSNKAFREDYEKRILSSLDSRLLSRDGRMRNPDEKPILAAEVPPPKESETPAIKANSRRPIETASVQKAQKEETNKPEDAGVKAKAAVPEATEESIVVEKPQKQPPPEIDMAKLKELKKEEEVAKAKQALERKKKLAEKAAAKAAARAQKEAEKKQKEREKKAKKKAGAAASATPDDSGEADTSLVEPEEATVSTEAPVPPKEKAQKETVRYRNRSKAHDVRPKLMLKRKKSSPYWVWAAYGAALSVVIVGVAGYAYFLGRN